MYSCKISLGCQISSELVFLKIPFNIDVVYLWWNLVNLVNSFFNKMSPIFPCGFTNRHDLENFQYNTTNFHSYMRPYKQTFLALKSNAFNSFQLHSYHHAITKTCFLKLGFPSLRREENFVNFDFIYGEIL